MDNVLHDIFIQEAEENLQILENRIISIEENPDDKNMINDAFRAIHSIKGGAGLAGFSGIKDFSHLVEDLFECIRSGSLKIQEKHVSVILKSLDVIKMMINNIKENQDSNSNINTEEIVDLITEIVGAAAGEKKENTSQTVLDETKNTNLFYLDLKYYQQIFTSGIDPLMFLEDLRKVGEVLFIHGQTRNLPDISSFDPERFYLSWQLFYKTEKDEKEILDIFCFVEAESDITIKNLNSISNNPEALKDFSIDGHTLLDYESIQIQDENTEKQFPENKDRRKANRRKTDSVSDSSIRVQTKKLENIFNTVGELLITQARLNMLTEQHEEILPDSFSTVTDSLKNVTQLLQEQVTSLRMMSLNNTFDRFKRVVRDIAADRGKKVRLLVEGQETELDKNMIEKLNDPLKHLVRNCIDHGIETEQERSEKGKAIEGMLKLSAYLESGKVVIEVGDDGKGIDKNKLLKKAEEKGLIPTDTHLSEKEILSLIFYPGLSTAEKVTDLSGRGVGMDVVKNCINELHGNIDISSEKDRGTTFKLFLPLTLASLDGMLVSVGKEKYIIPTLAILEIFRAKKEHMKTVSAHEEVVFFRGDYIPLIRLHKTFKIPNSIEETTKGELIVIKSGETKAALLVDKVLEQYQIVLKSIQKNFKKVELISSATILGNGAVALIVDIQNLINASLKVKNV